MTERKPLSTEREVALVEVVDRALGAGVVITGDIMLSLADVDLVYLNLRLLVSSVDTLREGSGDPGRDEAVIELGNTAQ